MLSWRLLNLTFFVNRTQEKRDFFRNKNSLFYLSIVLFTFNRSIQIFEVNFYGNEMDTKCLCLLKSNQIL